MAVSAQESTTHLNNEPKSTRFLSHPNVDGRNMVDDSGTDEEIPLPNVKTAILSKVIDYCKYHKDSPPEEIQKPLKSTNLAPWRRIRHRSGCLLFILMNVYVYCLLFTCDS